MAKPTFVVLPVMFAYMAQLATTLNLPGQSVQSTVLINSAIYVFGGDVHLNTVANLYVLDVSQPWNCTTPAWSNSTNDTPDMLSAMDNAIWPSPDNNSFYIWGGDNYDRKPLIQSGFAQYNVVNRTWSRPITNPNTPKQRAGIVAAWTQGIAYIWGGKSNEYTGDNSTQEFDDIISFDMIKLLWNSLNVTGSIPLYRSWYTATILSDGQIVIIGGYIRRQLNATSDLALMSDIPVFKILNICVSAIHQHYDMDIPKRHGQYTSPTSRAHCCTDYISIIICCGSDGLRYYNDVVVLNTRTWSWTQPDIVGTAPTSRSGHSSVMVNGQMIMFFGYKRPLVYLNDVNVLDTRSTPFQWTGGFTPGPTTTMTSSGTEQSDVGVSGLGIGSVIGISVAGVFVVVVAAIVIRKPWRSHKKQSVHTYHQYQ
ncbi:LOW QUALITY PROTEIN: hypothetical protein BC938DRAFT_473245 [Jimgerdemannia flammicorona]|uniref:Galactose oxidase n=1 Tax=Jimgerdemannia flammicorona TaxID=994334 RepID=A0A433Q4U0_9FUNG|nr:LOW QUALITY PROTEIN: hypothetical protein BC938DRAFT_473245 [Jimgerdemannia flammicorona]